MKEVKSIQAVKQQKVETDDEEPDGPIDRFNLDFYFVTSFVDVVCTINQDETPTDLIPLAYEAATKLRKMKKAFDQLIA